MDGFLTVLIDIVFYGVGKLIVLAIRVMGFRRFNPGENATAFIGFLGFIGLAFGLFMLI